MAGERILGITQCYSKKQPFRCSQFVEAFHISQGGVQVRFPIRYWQWQQSTGIFRASFVNVIAKNRRNVPSRVFCENSKVHFLVVEILSNFYLVIPSDSKERSSNGRFVTLGVGTRQIRKLSTLTFWASVEDSLMNK